MVYVEVDLLEHTTEPPAWNDLQSAHFSCFAQLPIRPHFRQVILGDTCGAIHGELEFPVFHKRAVQIKSRGLDS
jgi:hypothetical protein